MLLHPLARDCCRRTVYRLLLRTNPLEVRGILDMRRILKDLHNFSRDLQSSESFAFYFYEDTPAVYSKRLKSLFDIITCMINLVL